MMIQAEAENTSLYQLATTYGEVVPCAGNLPLTLDDPESVWYIERGSVNLFLVEIRDGVEQSLRQHIMHCEAGFMMPGVGADKNQETEETKFIIIAKGITGTVLRKIPFSRLNEVKPSEVAEKIDSWVLAFSKVLSRFVPHLPRAQMLTESGSEQTIEPGTFSIQRGVLWLSGLPQGTSLFMGIVDGAEFSDKKDLEVSMTPLTWTTWLTVLQNTSVTLRNTLDLIEMGSLDQALSGFHSLAFYLEHLNRKLALVDDANLERVRKASRNTAQRISREQLFNIYDLPIDKTFRIGDTSLVDAMNIIGKHEGIDFKFPSRTDPTQNSIGLNAILDTSSIRSRRISLRNSDQWWKTDGNAILAFMQVDDQPVVLLPGLFGRYHMIDPVKKTKTNMNPQKASLLKQEAWMFYRPFPDRKVQAYDLVQMAFQHATGNVIRMIIAGIPGGILNIVPALALGITVALIFQGGDQDSLLSISLAVIAFGVIAALLHVLQDKSLMHLKDRAISRLEAAFWDRVLRLPSRTLNNRPTSEIAIAGMTFQHLRNGEQLEFIENFLSLIFILPIIIFICFFDFTLGLVTLGFCIVALVLTVLVGLLQIEPHGKVIRATQKTSSKLFQIIEGIVKLRIERAEGSAYAIWARDYRSQKKAEVELGTLERHAQALSVALPFLAGATLFFFIAIDNNRSTPVGDFLIVYVVFLTFLSVTTKFGESIGTLALGVKTMEQLSPVLKAETEISDGMETVEHLNGDILFDRVSFRYEQDGPLILDDVTIHARPGEFIAIAGESGAGKSTLFKLALGIDQPTSGAILYDGQDLRHLNLKQLRRQVGAVPQSIRLHTQDIWDNIAINQEETTTEMVWDSARAAQIENEIKAMPMGLMTIVGSSGAVLSGGESQRIALARSLLGNPRVLLLDEATNWLDNTNQAEVMQNLAKLLSTRIVIAHRLSTLEKADRIYVLKAGKVVQTGTFNELKGSAGVFKNLIDRQDT